MRLGTPSSPTVAMWLKLPSSIELGTWFNIEAATNPNPHITLNPKPLNP